MENFLIEGNSVTELLVAGLQLLYEQDCAHLEESRNGPVVVARGPVLIHNRQPQQRVLFSPHRNANPFFHLFESLWMLAGRNDLPWLTQFNKQMAAYSDNGGLTQPAAYGHRWRQFFKVDQLRMLELDLKADPGTRRAVLGMWGPATDLSIVAAGGADVPCNTNCFFTLRDDVLHMSVQCRSNDMWWGAHGANAVHFSVLQEYLAAKLDVEVGSMYQYAWNYHAYTDVVKANFSELAKQILPTDLYAKSMMAAPLFPAIDVFDNELDGFMAWADSKTHRVPGGLLPDFRHPLLHFATVMLAAWDFHKIGDYSSAMQLLETPQPYDFGDWRYAGYQWLERKMEKKNARA